MAIFSRRTLLASAPLGVLLRPGAPAREAVASPAGDGSGAGFAKVDAGIAQEFVSVCHGNLARATELLSLHPVLANAAIDWGFGDFETALGAAAHTGRRKIALLLLEHGARLDLFAAAMLGMLDVVKAMATAQPGVQKTLGPHGITLLRHAEAGGEESKAVVEYLKELGGADEPTPRAPLSGEDAAIYVGEYVFGEDPLERFAIRFEKAQLSIAPAGGKPERWLYRVADGGHEFFPAGAPSVRLVFDVEGGRAISASVRGHTRRVDARRM